MLISQFNPIRFYTDKRSRQWQHDNSVNVTDMVFLPQGQVPVFQLIVDLAYENLAIKVYNTNDELLDTVTPEELTAEDETTYTRIRFNGDLILELDDEFVYLAIPNGDETYYSDVFSWKDFELLDESYLKLSVESADIRSGFGSRYLYDFNEFLPEFYLNGEVLSEEPKIEQTASEEDGLTIPAYGTRTIAREWNVDSNRQIWLYLSALNVLLVNGTVGVTWNYETYYPNQIDVTKEEGHGEGLYQVKLSLIDANESDAVCNEIIE